MPTKERFRRRHQILIYYEQCLGILANGRVAFRPISMSTGLVIFGILNAVLQISLTNAAYLGKILYARA